MSTNSTHKKKRNPPLRTTLIRGELDGRKTLARGFDRVKSQIIEAMGGDITPMQEMLLERCVFKVWRCVKMEERMLTGEEVESYTAYYLSWANSLRRDLEVLGLKGNKKGNEPRRCF